MEINQYHPRSPASCPKRKAIKAGHFSNEMPYRCIKANPKVAHQIHQYGLLMDMSIPPIMGFRFVIDLRLDAR